jgi:hypothetical protein
VHLGVKTMQHFKAISLILGFALFTFGCNASEEQVSAISIKAEAVPEGICVTLENIPSETTNLFIYFFTNDIISFSHITDDSLDQIKKTGKIIFPYVKGGELYSIYASFDKKDFQFIERVNTECITKNGIYFDRNIEFKLDDTHTSITLSSEPEFSSEVIFEDNKYDYGVYINIRRTETEVISLNADFLSTNELFWVFEPRLTDKLKIWIEHMEIDSYTVFITAYCKIIYDNITWNVEIARTPEFTFSL